jgi:CRISPR-associated exonuclease Cas4
MFTVTDLKQMAYCPRIVYYDQCLPGLRVTKTATMEFGAEANDKTEALEHRRSLRAYGLKAGERSYDVRLESDRLGLRGRLDMLIDSAGELIPVDYKDSVEGGRPDRGVQRNWAIQLAAYAMLVEDERLCQVSRGFIYYIPARRAKVVLIDPPLRDETRALLAEMRAMVLSERQPGPTTARKRCEVCEYRRFCNDV